MKWTGQAAVVSSLLALTGCSSGQSGESFPVRTVNTEEIHPIPGEAEITSARDLIVVDSTLWVLNGQAPFITRVSLSTGEVQEFGAHGGGPQEFQAPWAIQPVEGRAAAGVWIWDLGRREVLTIDVLGNWRGASPITPHGLVQARENIRDVSFVDPFRVRASQEGTIIARYPGPVHRTSDASTGAIWGASIQLEPRTELARFGGSGNRGFGDLRESRSKTSKPI
jgi:hypothetical protein